MEVALEIQKFQDSVDCKIPQTVGATDGTHIGINSPTGDSKIDYFNRKVFIKHSSCCRWQS